MLYTIAVVLLISGPSNIELVHPSGVIHVLLVVAQ